MIKKMKKTSSYYFAGAFFALTLLTSCEKKSNETTVAEERTEVNASPLARYSGEELFNGIFFFENNVCQNIQSLKDQAIDMNKLALENKAFGNFLTDMKAIVADAIKKNNPNYFVQFKQALMSNDRYLIKQTITEASNRIIIAACNDQKYGNLFLFAKNLGTNQNDAQLLKNLNPDDEKDRAQINEIINRNLGNASAKGTGPIGMLGVAVTQANVVTNTNAVVKSTAAVITTAVAVTKYLAITKDFVFETENQLERVYTPTLMDVLINDLAGN